MNSSVLKHSKSNADKNKMFAWTTEWQAGFMTSSNMTIAGNMLRRSL